MATDNIIAESIGMTFRRQGVSHEVLSSLDLYIPAGGFVSLLGPSGCGKSTLLKILGGLEDPTTGNVRIGEEDVHTAVRNGRIGLVQQKAALLPWKTALENTSFLIELSQPKTSTAEARRRAFEALELVGLTNAQSKLPHELSGGMAQRVSIARALALDPSILYMDEPFGALDAITRDQMNLLLQELWSATGKTIVFVTHSISEAVFLSDTVHVMSSNPGRITLSEDILLPRPRDGRSASLPEFVAYEEKLREQLDLNVEAARNVA